MEALSLRQIRTSHNNIHQSEALQSFLLQTIGYYSSSELLFLNDYEHRATELSAIGFEGIIVDKFLNNFRRINKYLEAVNSDLDEGQYFVTCLITKKQRKQRIIENQSTLIGYLLYGLDFMLHRVIPKISVTKKLYFKLTKGKNRALTLTEGLGRLACCGFKIIEYKEIGDKTYVITQKTKKPAYDFNPTYGPVISLNRYGNKGELIKVYKFRTMHPYSEYLQDFIYERNSLTDNGKFKDDFRVTSWAKFLRKCWLDELPMFYNLLKGDLKLIGVRPISKQYFNLYPDYLKELRKNVKPGLLPPFYADMPNSLEEIIESEIKYLESYMENPIKTDLIYGYKILKNIFFKKARSK